MTPIPPSYVSRTMYHQHWVEPEEASAPADIPPRGGQPSWPAAAALIGRIAGWLGTKTRVPPLMRPATLREVGR